MSEDIRYSEYLEYARLDGELVDAEIAGDQHVIDQVKAKIADFEKRSLYIDFTLEKTVTQSRNSQLALDLVTEVQTPTFSSLLKDKSNA